jgi:pantothenate kinase
MHKIQSENNYFIGVCGIPGAGKSTISDKLKQSLPDSIIIPMDGFHLYRKDLDEEGTRRRGAPFTFDLKRFKEKLLELKQAKSFPIKFPSFDHALKDPIEGDICVK